MKLITGMATNAVINVIKLQLNGGDRFRIKILISTQEITNWIGNFQFRVDGVNSHVDMYGILIHVGHAQNWHYKHHTE